MRTKDSAGTLIEPISGEQLRTAESVTNVTPNEQAVVDAIVALNKETGVTVLLSEQFARPVLPMVDRAYVVENGMLSLSGTGAELMNNPEIKAAYFGV